MQPAELEAHNAALERLRIQQEYASALYHGFESSDDDDEESDEEDYCSEDDLQAVVRAALSGDTERCSAALDACELHGVDPNRLTSNGRSSLLASCHAGHAPVTALLMLRGVRASSRGWNGTIALHVACAEGHIECARLLVGDLDDNTISDVDGSGSTALLVACTAGHTECASLMLERGAQADAAKPVVLETALHAASAGGHVGCVALCLSHGASPDLANQEGATALHLAAEASRADHVEIMQVTASGDRIAALPLPPHRGCSSKGDRALGSLHSVALCSGGVCGRC